MKIKPGTRHSDEEDGILIFIELKIIWWKHEVHEFLSWIKENKTFGMHGIELNKDA